MESCRLLQVSFYSVSLISGALLTFIDCLSGRSEIAVSRCTANPLCRPFLCIDVPGFAKIRLSAKRDSYAFYSK